MLQEGENAVVEDIAPLCHHIIIQTTQQSLSTGCLVDLATEQSIIFFLPLPGLDEWKTAISMMQVFARWQHLIFSGSALNADNECGPYNLADVSNIGVELGDMGSEVENMVDAEALGADDLANVAKQLGIDFDVEAEDAQEAVDMVPFNEEEELGPLAFALLALYQLDRHVDDDDMADSNGEPAVDMQLRFANRAPLPTRLLTDPLYTGR